MVPTGCRATVLLVDDDAGIRRLVRRILTEDSYHVIEAGNGAEALEVSSAYDGPIHLLLTDVIMPKVNGLVLSERLAQTRPETTVLFMSGYAECSLLVAKRPEIVLLRKPFKAEQLLAFVRGALADTRTEAARKPPSGTSGLGGSSNAGEKAG